MLYSHLPLTVASDSLLEMVLSSTEAFILKTGEG